MFETLQRYTNSNWPRNLLGPPPNAFVGKNKAAGRGFGLRVLGEEITGLRPDGRHSSAWRQRLQISSKALVGMKRGRAVSGAYHATDVLPSQLVPRVVTDFNYF